MSHPVIEADECIACGVCVDACPAGVLELNDVATVTDEAAITDLLGALGYASWRTVATNPPAADAQYTLRCLQSSVGILDSGTLHEVLSFTTYEGGFIELGVLNVGSIVFEVPQADVDALNALAEEG